MSAAEVVEGMEPGSAAWQRVVTASKVPAILGVSPWASPLSMWRLMKGLDEPQPQSTVQRRGQLLEDAVLAWWGEQHPEVLRVDDQPLLFLPGVPWATARPDAHVTLDDESIVLVEAKTAARMDDWGQPGTDEVPAYYLAQACWQLAMCPDAQRVYIPVLGPFLEFAEYVIERDDELIGEVFARCEEFHASLSGDVPPPLSDHPADYDAIRRTTSAVEEATVRLDAALAEAYRAVLAAEDAGPIIRTRVLDAMGTARRACDETGSALARRQTTRGGVVSLVRAVKKGSLASLITEPLGESS